VKKFYLSLVIIFLFGSPLLSKPLNINFNVYRNDTKIGYHKLTFSKSGLELNVLIEIEFFVKFLGINFYSYKHINREKWKNNRMISIESSTNINGKDLNCKVDDPESSVIPSSYWNYLLVKNQNVKQMLNTQDCSIIDIQIRKVGREKIYNNFLVADHFKISGKEITGEIVDIDIWYNLKKEWVKMIFKKDDSKIEYFLEEYDDYK